MHYQWSKDTGEHCKCRVDGTEKMHL